MTNTRRTAMMTAAILALGATLLTAAPAQADGYQEDVQACRFAMTNQGGIDMSEYRLRFEYKTGQRVRTINLKAIPHKNGQAFRFTCHINRSQVVALNSTGPYTMLAWSK